MKTSTKILIGGGVAVVGLALLARWMGRKALPQPMPSDPSMPLPDQGMMPQGMGPADEYFAVGEDGTPGARRVAPPSAAQTMAAESRPDAAFVASATAYEAPMSAAPAMLGATTESPGSPPVTGTMIRQRPPRRVTSAYGY